MSKLYCYEMEAMGGRWWEVYDESDGYVSIDTDEFGGWLANARTLGYDVYINTYESWEAMDEFLPNDFSY